MSRHHVVENDAVTTVTLAADDGLKPNPAGRIMGFRLMPLLRYAKCIKILASLAKDSGCRIASPPACRE
jgi:hypothetical protein